MSLHELLCGSARRWAATALDAYMEDPPDLDFAVHHMAVAVEHLSKAYLCSISEVLLLGHSYTLDDLLILSGHEGKGNPKRPPLKTIGGDPVLRRVDEIRSRMSKDRQSECLQGLRESRNGITHLGQEVATGDVRVLLADGIAYLNDLLTELGKSTAAFWGAHDSLTAGLVTRTTAERELRYRRKLEEALARYRRRFGTLPDTQGAGAFATMSHIPDLLGFSVEATCPACGNRDVPVKGTKYSRADGPSLRVWFAPQKFSCELCHLVLEGDELELAGITGSFFNDGDDWDWWLDGLPEWDTDHDLTETSRHDV
jgi:hypothetical protein